MASALEIREQLERLLSGQVSLDAFEEWFVPYSWNIHKHGDAEAQDLAFAIERQLAEFDEDSEALRLALENLIHKPAYNRAENAVFQRSD